jgi:hypothetical protein
MRGSLKISQTPGAKETVMGNDHSHVHYTPSSVGALMDPGFLRQAVHDADSPHELHSEPMLFEPSPRWRMAVLSVVRAGLHHLHL